MKGDVKLYYLYVVGCFKLTIGYTLHSLRIKQTVKILVLMRTTYPAADCNSTSLRESIKVSLSKTPNHNLSDELAVALHG